MITNKQVFSDRDLPDRCRCHQYTSRNNPNNVGFLDLDPAIDRWSGSAEL